MSSQDALCAFSREACGELDTIAVEAARLDRQLRSIKHVIERDSRGIRRFLWKIWRRVYE